MKVADLKSAQRAARYIASWLEYRFAHSDFPGLAVAIQAQGEIVLERAWGLADVKRGIPLTPDHTFRIASQSKMLTANAILQLVEKKKLTLDTPISQYLPWFQSSKDKRIKELTTRQLLSHSAGVMRDGVPCNFWHGLDDFPNDTALKKSIQSATLAFDENTYFKYSNFGFSALGLLVKKISGLAYNDYIQRRILNPLKMNRELGPELDKLALNSLAIGYSKDFFKEGRTPKRHICSHAYSPSTGAYGNPRSLCRFAASQFLGNDTLLSDRSKRELQRVQFFTPECQIRYGLGMQHFQLENWNLLGHGGNFPGFVTHTLFEPHLQLTVSVMTNATDGPAGAIAEGIFQGLKHFEENRSRKDTLTVKELKKFQGRFFAPWGATDIVFTGKSLTQISPETWNPFVAGHLLSSQSNRRLLIPSESGYHGPGEEIVFSFDKKSGKPNKIVQAGHPAFPLEVFMKMLKNGQYQ